MSSLISSSSSLVSRSDEKSDSLKQETKDPLYDALKASNNKRLKELLIKGEDANNQWKLYYNEYPLTICIEEGNLEGVKLLIQYGANVNKK